VKTKYKVLAWKQRHYGSTVLESWFHAAGPECENARSPTFVWSPGLT